MGLFWAFSAMGTSAMYFFKKYFEMLSQFLHAVNFLNHATISKKGGINPNSALDLSALSEIGILCKIIDVQSLLPFDLAHETVKSIQKTNRLLIVDEDVPGGASAYLMQEILEVQNGYQYLDSKPTTLTAKAHRPAYGTDGDYFSKPSAEDIYEKIYGMMQEAKPQDFERLFP
jgi:pyruvate/2-oxoglutarate/acetoin dehydrogenase E1 component